MLSSDMKTGWKIFRLTAACMLAATTGMAREEMIPLTEKRAISVKVPDGFNYKSGVNARGELVMTLTDPKEELSLTVVFEPDAEEEFKEARARKEKMFEAFKNYVEQSREKAMQFEELEPKVGAGTYCVFTDDKLQGKPPAEFPKGEYLHLTAGVKAWPGIVATWTLFSNERESERYQTLLKVLRESVHEKPAPLL